MERCPVCRAILGEDGPCRRCGADLQPLRRVVEEGRRLERLAVRALRQGDPARARDLVDAALALRRTPMALALREFAALLDGQFIAGK